MKMNSRQKNAVDILQPWFELERVFGYFHHKSYIRTVRCVDHGNPDYGEEKLAAAEELLSEITQANRNCFLTGLYLWHRQMTKHDFYIYTTMMTSRRSSGSSSMPLRSPPPSVRNGFRKIFLGLSWHGSSFIGRTQQQQQHQQEQQHTMNMQGLWLGSL